MILPDVNVLLYAFRRDSPRHGEYQRWLEALVNAPAAYGIAPQVLASVIRISTHTRIYAQPSTLDEAIKFCRILLTPDICTVVQPGDRHWDIFVDLCAKSVKSASGRLSDCMGADWTTAVSFVLAHCGDDGTQKRIRGFRRSEHTSNLRFKDNGKRAFRHLFRKPIGLAHR